MKRTKLPLGGSSARRRSHSDTSTGQGASPVNNRQKSSQVESVQEGLKRLDQSNVRIVESRKASAVSSKHEVPMESKDETSTYINEPATGGKRQRPVPRHTSIESRHVSSGNRRVAEPAASDLPEQTEQVNDVLLHGDSSLLYAKEEGRDRITRVLLFLEGSCLNPPLLEDNPTMSQLGNDGNQYWCQVCHEFGNVVCCDGCPRVYHKECIPLDNTARKSLDQDEDPWYCPECIEDSVPTTFSEQDTSPSKASIIENSVDGAIAQCKECGNKVEQPSVLEYDEDGEYIGLCTSCQIARDSIKESKGNEDAMIIRKSRRRAPSYHDDYVNEENDKEDELPIDHDNDDEEGEDKEEENDGSRKLRKRRADSVASDKQDDETKLKTKKKQKLSKKSRIVDDQAKSSTHNEDDLWEKEEEDSPLQQEGHQPELVKATPAFYFYLAENRWKIERVLARKHRYFNRLPKGDERNELVAREAAMWWVKLRPVDHRRYMTMSMRDFEARIIEWKEEKNLREMSNEQDSQSLDITSEHMPTNGDHKEMDLNNQRFQDGNVGTKPYTPESADAPNRVLPQLLHDLRFGKCPLVEANRVENTTAIDEHAKSLIPYFEVHGPLSTSIGDECLGCSRGWKHYCHVLNRPIPAVEPRAKLQPPLSSLMATRVGLGLRPRIEREQHKENGNNDDATDRVSPFLWRTTEDWRKMQDLPVLPSCSLGEPSDRFDDVATFIEDVTAMNVERITLNGDTTVSKNSWLRCGRCEALTKDKAGCIQCRRAQLIVNLSKKQPPGSEFAVGTKTDGKALKVQTVMLGRVQAKDGHGETHPGGEDQVSSRILKSRWAPLAILPPRALIAPSKTNKVCLDDDDDDEDDEISGDESQVETFNENVYVSPEDQAENYSFPDMNNAITSTSESRQVQERCPGRLRQPPTRLLVSSTSDKDYSGPARRKLEKRKGMVGAFESRCKTVACYGILLSSLRHDPLRLFTRPIDDEEFVEAVRDYVDFGTIKDNVLDHSYDTIGGLVEDIERMCKAVLSFYPAQSVLWKYAKDIQESLLVATSRTTIWMKALLDACQKYMSIREQNGEAEDIPIDDRLLENEPFEELRNAWPEAVEMLEAEEALRSRIEADFMRTQENERAYYGSLVVKRVAAAASAALAPYPNSTGEYAVVVGRDETLDKELRSLVDQKVASVDHFVDLRQVSSLREESIVKLLRKVQNKRIERKSHAEHSCSRCLEYDVISNKIIHLEGKRKRGEDGNRKINSSRSYLSTGLASTSACESSVLINEAKEKLLGKRVDSCVSVRPSRIHGLGLFADQQFKKDQVVAEYVGEYINKQAIASRQKTYRENKRKDFILSITDALAIDATMKGGPGRFLNHSCLPNCIKSFVKTVGGETTHERILFVATRDIQIHEEITYDYRLELVTDLEARVPCNCQANSCRGFMVCLKL